MIDRILSPYLKKTKKSVLILGPRQIGKSTLMSSIPHDLKINLADESVLLEFAGNPSYLKDLIERSSAKTIFIDEVQNLPSLLNTVQFLIDEQKKKFYLTGSSARKLKRGGANLLPGRVINYSMGPIIAKELNYKLNIKEHLSYGFLPEMITTKNEKEKQQLLISYCSSYIREEIQAEALTKSLEAFVRFINELCSWTAQFVDYTKLSKRAAISRHTCPNYFEILEDTLVGFRIFPDKNLLEEFDLVKHPKFYFFDVGILTGLQKDFSTHATRAGILTEQVVFQQLHHSATALQKNFEISSFRTRGGLEVDFILKLDGDIIPIEAKYSDHLISSDAQSLNQIKKTLKKAKPYIFHAGKKEMKVGGIWALPLATGLKEIGL